MTTWPDLLPAPDVAGPGRSHPHRARSRPAVGAVGVVVGRVGSRVWVGTRHAAGAARRAVAAAVAVTLRTVFAVAVAVAGPPARAAWADAKTLAGYWPGVAGLGCLVKAAALVDPAAGWVAAGVALLLVGAVARG